jgi:hypothetical protein
LWLTALALALPALAGAAPPSQSDEFDGTALDGWALIRGEDQGDGVAHGIEVGGGVLALSPKLSWWVDDTQALYLYKPRTGDFVATMRVKVTGVDGTEPESNWTLSGILLRSPASGHGHENWLAFRTGWVNGVPTYERKTTRSSRSDLVLSTAPTGWVDLRIARVGYRFFFLKRDSAGRWVHHWTYTRPDLPRMLEVGVDAFSGYESQHADMTSRVDWFRFAPTRLPKSAKTPQAILKALLEQP